MVEVSFASRATRKACQTPEAIFAMFGEEVGRELIARLADIRAAASVEELATVLPLEMSDEGSVRIIVDTALSLALVCTAAHVNCPRDGEGRPVWDAVVRLQVLEIEVKDEAR